MFTKEVIIILSILAILTLGLVTFDRPPVIFQGDDSIVCQNAYGDVAFYVGEVEKLRIKESGDFLVEGRLTFNDKKIYESFREWIVENKGDLKVIK